MHNGSKVWSITDRDNSEQLKDIRESTNALEGGRIFDV